MILQHQHAHLAAERLAKSACRAQSRDAAPDDHQVEPSGRYGSLQRRVTVDAIAHSMRRLNHGPRIAVGIRVVADATIAGEIVDGRAANARRRHGRAGGDQGAV